MTDDRARWARRRALVWTGGYAAAVVGVTSLLPLWVYCHPTPFVAVWYSDSICFWAAVAHAADDSDWQDVWSGANLRPTMTLLALAVGTWPVVYGLAVWCRPPAGASDYEDWPAGPRIAAGPETGPALSPLSPRFGVRGVSLAPQRNSVPDPARLNPLTPDPSPPQSRGRGGPESRPRGHNA